MHYSRIAVRSLFNLPRYLVSVTLPATSFLGEELHIFVAEFLVKKSEKTEEPLFLMDHSCHDDFFDIFWHLKLYIFLFSS